MKLVKYQLTNKKYLYVEAKNNKEEDLIKELNRLFYQSRDKDYFYRKNVLSLNRLQEKGYQITDNTLINEIISKELRELLISKIKQLSSVQQLVINYMFFLNYTTKEIATMFNTTNQNINQIKNRALKKLKELLSNT